MTEGRRARVGRRLGAGIRGTATVLAALLIGTVAAYAYFTAGGSTSGAASVGTSTNWSVTGASGSGAPTTTGLMYPGGTPATFAYRITNAGSRHQQVGNVQVAVATATDGHQNTVVVDSSTGLPVPGCLAGWFSAGPSAFTDAANAATTLPKDLAGGGYVTGATPVSLTDADLAQDACAGV